MTYIYKRLLLLLVFCAMSIPKLQANATPTSKPAGKIRSYPSMQSEGLIGVTEESPVDNPVDNIFHVNISESLCGNEKIWLTYELEGVADHTSVSRSINDQVSVGGYLVKRRRGWAMQREQISASWLKEGDNVVRFTMPENALHSYRIRNLKIEVRPSEINTEEVQIIFNQPSTRYYFGKAYIKGIVTDAEGIVRINIDGKEARMFNGEFESVIDFESDEQSCVVEVEAVYADGSTTCHSVSFTEPQSADFTYSLENYTYKKEQFFQGKESQSITLNGAALTTTRGALTNAAALSITTLRAVDIAPLDAGMENVTKHHAGFRFLPHGTVFNKEVSLRIPYDAGKIPDGYTEADIRTYYFDEQSHHWVPLKLDTVLAETAEVLSQTLHFTDYINAIIKVPESPEVEAYNSTSMKGIKAANPTAAVNLINTPQANNTGSASLSYPINIPAGRGGMQPQLSISYNSSGGNGWMGLGWNLSLPMISIDTRWGVPRYDPEKETETYTFNGEQLTPVAHRGELQSRYPDRTQFYPRVEGAFNRIVRRGNNPSDYWWEVTDKSGTKYFYGATNAGFDKNAVLRTNEKEDAGFVAQWCLREVRDLNGNGVQYHYIKVEDSGVNGGTVPGYQIYIDKITYTSHQGGEGPYSVVFTRDRELSESKRADVSIIGNLGFKQVTADLLRKIEVQFEDKNIRSYELSYGAGEFKKTLLDSISEFDAEGKLFNSHVFDYYNEVQHDEGFKPLLNEDSWIMPGDDISGDFKTNVSGFNDEATALSGTKSKDKSIGLAISIGLGFNVFTKAASAGISGGYSKSDSEGLLTMMDMNGDGLQDKVFAKNKTLYYSPNLLSKTGKEEFAENEIPIITDGIDAFYKDKSKTVSYGAEAQFVAFVGYSHSNTTTKTTVYFADVNGDQLPDIVKNGVVHFNHLDPETGIVTYSQTSEGTPNRIFSSGSISSDLVDREVLEQEQQAAIDQNPLLDIVRMWKAPYNGRITITAPIQLLQSNDPERADEPADGVRAAIQLQDTELWHTFINPDDYQPHEPTGVNNLVVNKGDMVFFRLGSRDNGSYDSVRWDPVIQYTDPSGDWRDANGKMVYRFSAKEDYILSSAQNVTPPFNGQVRVTGVLTKPQVTDDLRLFIIRLNSENVVLDTVWRRKYKWNEEVSTFPDTVLSVTDSEQYSFKAVAETNIDWNALVWRPHLIYESADDPAIDLSESTIEIFAVPEYSVFVNTLAVPKPFVVALDSIGQKDTLNITARLDFVPPSFPFPPNNGEITFSIKKTDTLLAKKVLTITNGEITSDSVVTVPVMHDDSIYIEYHTRSLYLAGNLSTFNASFSIQERDTTVRAALHTTEPFTEDREDQIFGPLYRRWGHFGWNGNRQWAEEAIDRFQLKISEEAKNQKEVDTEGMKGEDLESQGVYDAKKDRFFLLVASGVDQRWTSGDQFAYIASDVMSSSRLGDDDLSILSFNTVNGTGSGASGIDKINKSKGNAYTLGVSLGLSASKSFSDATSRTLTDFMDMNGDRYPDILSEKVIQYTDARGGLSEKTVPSLGFIQETHGTTEGTAVSGSFPMTMPKFRNSNKNGRPAAVDAGDANSTSGSISVSGGVTTGDNEANYSWMDINGDGLPDRVNMNTGKVSLNLGYAFTEPEEWGFGQIQASGSETESGGAGLGFTKGQRSISAGFSVARSDNFSNEVLMDVNGDGLPDKVKKGNPLQVWINTGNGFAAEALNWTGAASINENATASESGNLAFTVGFALFGVKWTVTPSVSAGHAVSRELSKFTDINGDGYPDFLKSTKDDNLTVSLSTIGRTNMLRSVKRPLGATFDLTYARIGNTYEIPNSMWVLDSVKVFDGFVGDGVDTMLTTYAYEGGLYDRHEREFYGFEKVITNNHDTEKKSNPVYTSVTQTFLNGNYYEKGLMTDEVMTDGAGNKFIAKKNIYQLKNISTGSELTETEKASDSGNAFPALIEASQEFYEGQSSPGKNTSMSYGYDTNGNVISYNDFGDEGDEDDLSASISYHSLDNLYLIGTPERITVTGAGKTYRKRESVIDPNTGNITQIKQFVSDNDISTHDMEYDDYGNLKKITRPKNAKDQRLSIEYTYDDKVQTYPTKVSNSYGYSSAATYDFRFGQKLTSKDLNANEISYELDDLGRVVMITGPYEKSGAGYTIKFEYHPEAIVPWALTRHFDPSDPKNDLLTSIFVDGLGRVLQTKKDVAIYEGEGKADTEMMAVSGRVKFDAFGRTVSALYPITEPSGTPGKFNPTEDTVKPTLSTYDVLNRTLTVTLPDLAVTSTTYGFENDREGKKQFSTKTTDANGKQTEQFTDVRGRVTSVKNHTSEKAVWTSFKYNAINEQIEATDDLGHTTFSVYDNFGRRTERRHPDAGTTTYSYDLAGNLTELVTANLAKEGLAILYSYEFERLTDITYPQNPENNVKYTYGESGASDNRAGRIVMQEDATGAQEFFYGPLGEVVKNVRTIVIPQHDEQTYTTEWQYDTWNRLTDMTYGDGEKVTYTYNSGGLLRSMTGRKKSASYNYVNQLGYDKFEQRVFLAYGNGTKTNYSYEPDRRRLKNLTASTAAKRLFMDNIYSYDKVNNILNLENKAPIPSPNLMGGASEYTYEYDDLYRLTSAEGSYKGSNDQHTYTLSMSYNTVGGITQKTQVHKRKDQEQKKTTYDLLYSYGETQPHAPTHIGDQTYTYDANGNQTGWTSDVSGQRRLVLWDEENRIRSIYDNGSQHHYVYDASGERVLKGKSTGQRIFVNGEWKAGSGQMGNYTVYVNPYLVLKSGGYTKHYYIEGQRIVSKLGGGWDNNGKGPLKAGGNKVDYVGKTQKVFDGIVKNLKFLGADGQILTAGKSGKIPPGQINGTGSVTESFRYFYHPDHLGSTSYVTDASGEVFQHLEYFAFGETFVEEHSNTDRTPYLFNGKELDEETGLYYYGARYYDPRTSVWQSVDPLAAKYPSISSYAFVANNPLLLVDPNGKEIWITYYAGGSPKTLKYIPGEEYKGKNKFLKEAYAALNYLNTTEKGKEVISKLHERSEKVTIKQGAKTEFDPETNNTWFNPTEGLKFDDKDGKKRQSPALGLVHELGHALRKLVDPEGFNEDQKDYADSEMRNQWTDPEEKRVIQEIENPIAEELNSKHKNNESPRDKHKIPRSAVITTTGSTSTQTKSEAKGNE